MGRVSDHTVIEQEGRNVEKLGAPRRKVAVLIAAGHAKSEAEAADLIRKGLFEKLMGIEPGEKRASKNRLKEQLDNTLED